MGVHPSLGPGGAAEVAIIAIHRAFRLMRKLELWLGIKAPEGVAKVEDTVKALRGLSRSISMSEQRGS